MFEALRFKSPLHPILVHFTIALTSISFVFDLISYFSGFKSLQDTGWWTLAAAVVVTVGTIFTGIYSRTKIPVGEGPARRFLRTHMALGPILFGTMCALAVWRAILFEGGGEIPGLYFAGAAVVFALVMVQGFLGGELVYRFGMEVRGGYR